MKKLLLLVALWLLNGAIFAQDTTFVGDTQEEYDDLFSELNWDKVTTGVLVDKTVIFSDLDANDGLSNFETNNSFKNWQQFYLEFYNASHVPLRDALQTHAAVSEQAHNFMEEYEKIPLLFLGYNYNRFVDGAVENGLLEIDSIETKKVYDQSGNEQLYTEHQLFAVASASERWNGGPVTFFYRLL